MKKPHLAFLFNFLTDRKEQKYLKQKRKELANSSKLAEIIDNFFATKTKDELLDWLVSQDVIKFKLTPELNSISVNNLKEKIAYELNEAVLKEIH